LRSPWRWATDGQSTLSLHQSEDRHQQDLFLMFQLKVATMEEAVANMASYAISSSLILMIHDNMINGTNHVV
jgi:hypothetical protein